MNIMLFDPNQYKFTKNMIEYWQKQGNEVRNNIYYNPEYTDWADVIWFDTADNNIVQATTHNSINLSNYDLTGKKIVVRPIDIEVWSGVHKGIDWSLVTDIVFPSSHIKEMMLPDIPPHVKIHDIPHGVNTDKFTFRNRVNLYTDPEPNLYNRKIAWVTRRWSAKGKEYALQIALALKKFDAGYTIYALGVDDYGSWEKAYFEYFIEKNQIDNIIWQDHADDMNTWLEDKDYALCCSKKETFSFAIAEGMSKGLKPIIHNFLGAEDIWDKKYIWNSIEEAVSMIINEDYNPTEYRKYIEDNYSLKKMMERIDHEVINNRSFST